MVVMPSMPCRCILEQMFGNVHAYIASTLSSSCLMCNHDWPMGAVVRALWLRFKVTSRRVSVSGGWLGRDRSQVIYSQIKEVRSVARGFGAWGDMVLVLSDGARLELRAVPRYREMVAFIEDRIGKASTPASSNTNGFVSSGKR